MNNIYKNLKDNSIIPARIRDARIARGYSLAELAELIGVTKQAISQYELGNLTPSGNIMLKLMEVLKFPISFFRKPKRNSNIDCSNSAVYFRSLKTTPKKLKEAYKKRIEWIDEIYNYFKQYINFPDVNLPDFGTLLDEELNIESIEKIAMLLRKHWNLGTGPINNMVEVLQENGFVISRIEFDNKKIDAFSQWYNGTPYIILGSDKSSSVRWRFDLAHELGHLILHSHIDEEALSNKVIADKIEDEAHAFAGAFLLPAETFLKDVVSTSIDHFLMLKKRWKVSVSAMIKRCEDLNIFTDNQIAYLKKQMTLRKMWRRELFDDQIEFEIPYIWKQAIELLLNSNILTPDELLDNLALNKEEIESLCFLPEGLLNRKSKVTYLTLKK